MNIWEVAQGISIVTLTIGLFAVCAYAGSLRIEVNQMQVWVSELKHAERVRQLKGEFGD